MEISLRSKKKEDVASAVETLANLRELGGLKIKRNRQVLNTVHNKIFRSANPAVTPDGLKIAAEQLKVKTLIDLRTQAEVNTDKHSAEKYFKETSIEDKKKSRANSKRAHTIINE